MQIDLQIAFENILVNAAFAFGLGLIPLTSQLITVSSVTLSFLAKSLIKSPASIRAFHKCSPNVFGFSG